MYSALGRQRSQAGRSKAVSVILPANGASAFSQMTSKDNRGALALHKESLAERARKSTNRFASTHSSRSAATSACSTSTAICSDKPRAKKQRGNMGRPRKSVPRANKQGGVVVAERRKVGRPRKSVLAVVESVVSSGRFKKIASKPVDRTVTANPPLAVAASLTLGARKRGRPAKDPKQAQQKEASKDEHGALLKARTTKTALRTRRTKQNAAVNAVSSAENASTANVGSARFIRTSSMVLRTRTAVALPSQNGKRTDVGPYVGESKRKTSKRTLTEELSSAAVDVVKDQAAKGVRKRGRPKGSANSVDAAKIDVTKRTLTEELSLAAVDVVKDQVAKVVRKRGRPKGSANSVVAAKIDVTKSFDLCSKPSPKSSVKHFAASNTVDGVVPKQELQEDKPAQSGVGITAGKGTLKRRKQAREVATKAMLKATPPSGCGDEAMNDSGDDEYFASIQHTRKPLPSFLTTSMLRGDMSLLSAYSPGMMSFGTPGRWDTYLASLPPTPADSAISTPGTSHDTRNVDRYLNRCQKERTQRSHQPSPSADGEPKKSVRTRKRKQLLPAEAISEAEGFKLFSEDAAVTTKHSHSQESDDDSYFSD